MVRLLGSLLSASSLMGTQMFPTGTNGSSSGDVTVEPGLDQPPVAPLAPYVTPCAVVNAVLVLVESPVWFPCRRVSAGVSCAME